MKLKIQEQMFKQPVINGSFDDIIKASVSGNPKPKLRDKKQDAKKHDKK